MNLKNYANLYFAMNPRNRIVMQEMLLIGMGIIGAKFNWYELPFLPYLNYLGYVLILIAVVLHRKAHQAFNQAHYKSAEINNLVTHGIYSKVRHPIYLSFIVMDVGIALAFGILPLLLLVIIFCYSHVATALREEKFLMERFSPEYTKYMQKVPYRIIPKVF